MKKLAAIFVILSLLCLSLASCVVLRDEGTDALNGKGDKTEESTDLTDGDDTEEDVETEESDSTDDNGGEIPDVSPGAFGFYDDTTDVGLYERLDLVSTLWQAGADITVLDVIPSSEEVLTGDSYRDIWSTEEKKLPEDVSNKVYFILEYTLKNGEERVARIATPADAEAVGRDGYLEVYLYDDVHQESGAWYSHLTALDMTADTVYSSIKLTAGAYVSDVAAIKLSVYDSKGAHTDIDISNIAKN